MKIQVTRFVLFATLGAMLTACGGIANAANADADVGGVVKLATAATARANTLAEGAALRQLDIVDLGLSSHRLILRFTKAPPTQEIVVVASPQVPPTQWQLHSYGPSPLTTSLHAALDLTSVRVGPEAAAAAMRRSLNGKVQVRTLTLVPEGGQAVWHVFGAVPGGLVSGKVSSLTSGFQLSGPGPAHQAAIAPRH